MAAGAKCGSHYVIPFAKMVVALLKMLSEKTLIEGFCEVQCMRHCEMAESTIWRKGVKQ